MDSRNTVSVKIYGQEYSISSPSSREYIMKIAEYVDKTMNDIGHGSDASASSVAVLGAINIADEMYKQKAELENALLSVSHLQSDAKRYEELWEDAKRVASKNADFDEETKRLHAEINELRAQNEELAARNEDLEMQLTAASSSPEEASGMVENLETRCRDLESSFFDIQMENIRLKNEIDALKHQQQG